MKNKIIIGATFGRLKVESRVSAIGAKRAKYAVICECGNAKEVDSSNLFNGSTQSCGCLPKGPITHGQSKTRMYRIWLGMHYRCKSKNKRDAAWLKNSVTVCAEWARYEPFYADMIAGYADNLTIERKDVTGNYCKKNCEWATIQKQQRNKRNTLRVEVGGKMVVLKDECERLGLTYHTVWQRIKRLNWPIEKALKP